MMVKSAAVLLDAMPDLAIGQEHDESNEES
jgi:hypothetical protein